VAQSDLETFLGASMGKFTIGLGQTQMSFCDDREGNNCQLKTLVYNDMIVKHIFR
jgi:hydroxymethylglutaryl-CoA synthase